jgi:hypothetical protein
MSEIKDEFPDSDQRLAVCYQQWEDKDKEKKSEYSRMERRFIPASEFRVIDEETKPKIVGYAAVFDKFSEDMWGFREKVAKGAFAESIKRKDDVRMLFNHNPDYIIARTTNGTLSLREDDKGLYFEGIPADTQWEKDLITKIKRGDISQNSFGFMIDEEQWEQKEKIRTLMRVTLFDVSPVTYPAYKDTEVHIRWRFGETTLPFKLAYKRIEEVEKREDEDPMVLIHRYGLTPNIYSAGPLDPTVFILPDDGKTAKTTIMPKPDEHFINPAKWAEVQEKLRRNKK